jgi:hypothetical protein
MTWPVSNSQVHVHRPCSTNASCERCEGINCCCTKPVSASQRGCCKLRPIQRYGGDMGRVDKRRLGLVRQEALVGILAKSGTVPSTGRTYVTTTQQQIAIFETVNLWSGHSRTDSDSKVPAHASRRNFGEIHIWYENKETQ